MTRSRSQSPSAGGSDREGNDSTSLDQGASSSTSAAVLSHVRSASRGAKRFVERAVGTSLNWPASTAAKGALSDVGNEIDARERKGGDTSVAEAGANDEYEYEDDEKNDEDNDGDNDDENVSVGGAKDQMRRGRASSRLSQLRSRTGAARAATASHGISIKGKSTRATGASTSAKSTRSGTIKASGSKAKKNPSSTPGHETKSQRSMSPIKLEPSRIPQYVDEGFRLALNMMRTIINTVVGVVYPIVGPIIVPLLIGAIIFLILVQASIGLAQSAMNNYCLTTPSMTEDSSLPKSFVDFEEMKNGKVKRTYRHSMISSPASWALCHTFGFMLDVESEGSSWLWGKGKRGSSTDGGHSIFYPSSVIGFTGKVVSSPITTLICSKLSPLSYAFASTPNCMEYSNSGVDFKKILLSTSSSADSDHESNFILPPSDITKQSRNFINDFWTRSCVSDSVFAIISHRNGVVNDDDVYGDATESQPSFLMKPLCYLVGYGSKSEYTKQQNQLIEEIKDESIQKVAHSVIRSAGNTVDHGEQVWNSLSQMATPKDLTRHTINVEKIGFHILYKSNFTQKQDLVDSFSGVQNGLDILISHVVEINGDASSFVRFIVDSVESISFAVEKAISHDIEPDRLRDQIESLVTEAESMLLQIILGTVDAETDIQKIKGHIGKISSMLDSEKQEIDKNIELLPNGWVAKLIATMFGSLSNREKEQLRRDIGLFDQSHNMVVDLSTTLRHFKTELLQLRKAIRYMKSSIASVPYSVQSADSPVQLALHLRNKLQSLRSRALNVQDTAAAAINDIPAN